MSLIVNTTSWADTNRLQFSIDTTTVSGAVVVPFMFKLSSSTGLGSYDCSYVFEQLTTGITSAGNRRKVIFSQLVAGTEQPLYCELDSWDHVAKLAFFYVKPLELASSNSNIFFFYFDKEQEDNTEYLAETNDFSGALAMDLGPEGTSDTLGVLAIDVVKVGDLYQMWYIGYDGSLWNMMYCESSDLITWTNHQVAFDHSHTYDSSHHHPGSVIYEDGVYRMWYSASDGTNYRILYCDSSDGINWTNFQLIIDLNTTPYNPNYSTCCTVVKEGSRYKMWYAGHDSSPESYKVIYCESLDGVTWVNHQMVISTEVGIYSAGNPYVRPCKVTYKEELYRIWVEAYDGTTWRPYYGESKDGINWGNFSLFTDLNTLGVYDTTHIGLLLTMYEEASYYYFFYGAHDGSNWRMITSKSVSLSTPKTPSQEVWSDFFSVHHLNSTYGYIDSTSSRLNVASTNDILPVSSNTGSSAVEFTSTQGNINLGTSTKYDYGSDTNLLMFSNITAGGRLYGKGDDIFTYYYDRPTATNATSTSFYDTFSGTNGDYPDSRFWYPYTYDSKLIESDVYIDNNRLKVHAKVSTENYASTYARAEFILTGDFDVEYAFSDYSYYSADSMGGIFAGGLIASAEEGSYWGLRIPGLSDLHKSGRVHSYGQMRITRVGTTYTIYVKDGPATTWTNVRSGGDGTAPDFQVLLRAYVSSGTDAYSTIYFESFSCTATSITYLAYSKTTPSLNTFWEKDVQSVLEQTSPDSDWHLYRVGRQKGDIGTNTFLDRSERQGYSGYSSSDYAEGISTYIGDPGHCALGKVADIWWSNTLFDDATLTFIEKALKDEVLEISTHFVHGYATEYGKAVATKILVYAKEDKSLLGYTDSSPYDGFYYVEVASSAECFVIALDGDFYNHFILGKVIPQNII